MSVNFTMRELRDLERFCLDQAEQSATRDGRIALRILADHYAAVAASLAASSGDPAAPLAPNFDARPAVDPYRLPPASVEHPTDPSSN